MPAIIGTATFAHYFLTNLNAFLNMKKTILGMLAGATLMFSLASCGEKLLSPEQVQAEITKGFDAGKAAVESEMNAACDADFEAKVTEKVTMMTQEAEAAAAQPAVGK